MARSSILAATVPIASIDDLTDAFRWFDALLEETAKEELAHEQARGNLTDPTILIDGRKSQEIAGAKIFGTIAFVDKLGPIDAAISAASALVAQRAPFDTGHYRRAMLWLLNGRPIAGTPSAEQVGPNGNAILVDLAPYASWLEVHIPSGILWGAYTVLKRTFGRRLNIGYRYANPEHIATQAWPPGARRGAHPYMVPMIVIGNPDSTVIPGHKPPRGNPSKFGRKRTSDRRAGRGHRESRGIGRGSGPKS